MTNVVDSLDQEYLAYSVLKSEFNWEAYACEIAVFFKNTDNFEYSFK